MKEDTGKPCPPCKSWLILHSGVAVELGPGGVSWASQRLPLPGKGTPRAARAALAAASHPAPSSAGLAEVGLPGPGGQTHPGLRAPDHGRRGGAALEGAGREAGQGVQAADGRVRVSPPGQERGRGQRGEQGPCPSAWEMQSQQCLL